MYSYVPFVCILVLLCVTQLYFSYVTVNDYRFLVLPTASSVMIVGRFERSTSPPSAGIKVNIYCIYVVR